VGAALEAVSCLEFKSIVSIALEYLGPSISAQRMPTVLVGSPHTAHGRAVIHSEGGDR